MPPKTTLNDSQRYEISLYIEDEVKKGVKMTNAAIVSYIQQRYQVTVSESTASRINASRQKRIETQLVNPDAKRHKPVIFPIFEQALKEFVLNYQHRTILTDTMLIEKAKLIATGLGIPADALRFSPGWLQKFKDRNGIRQQKLQGEADSADQGAIIESIPLLRERCSGYSLELIYNMDETGLFYRFVNLCLSYSIILTNSNDNIFDRLEPDKTLASKRLHGRKKNKERLSIALCANSDGSHKLDPLVIGKYAKPRCFKNVNIANMPVIYRNNRRAWMITTLFQEWLQDFDRQIGRKYGGKRALLLLDNCSSHNLEGLALRYIDVQFLPPNTTSKIQPMDAGIIMSFKRHYRRSHVR